MYYTNQNMIHIFIHKLNLKSFLFNHLNTIKQYILDYNAHIMNLTKYQNLYNLIFDKLIATQNYYKHLFPFRLKQILNNNNLLHKLKSIRDNV